MKKTARQLDSESMLKHCYVIQLSRVQQMLEFEQKTKFLMPDGHKNLVVLKDIAAEIRKLEIGEQWMKGKAGAMPDAGPYPGGLLPHGQTEQQGGQDDFARRFASFGDVDRRLMQEATSRVIDMIQEEAVELGVRPSR